MPAKKSSMLRGDEVLTFSYWPSEKKAQLIPSPNIILPILYEDEFLLAVNKPAGLPCLPLHAQETQSVINALLALRPEQAAIDPETWEGGLIHRLDNDTSGALLFAKSREAKQKLKQLNQKGQIEKIYQCWVQGHVVSDGELSLPLAHHPKNKKKMIVVTEEDKIQKLKARPAYTQYQVIKHQGDLTLLRVKITRGARHQIRVHLANAGFPILGDKLYGLPDPNPTKNYDHHLLHATEINFQHPWTQQNLKIVAPTPKSFFGTLGEMANRKNQYLLPNLTDTNLLGTQRNNISKKN